MKRVMRQPSLELVNVVSKMDQVNKLNFIIHYSNIRPIGLDPGDQRGELFLQASCIRSDQGASNLRALPDVVMRQFRSRDIEFLVDAGQ